MDEKSLPVSRPAAQSKTRSVNRKETLYCLIAFCTCAAAATGGAAWACIRFEQTNLELVAVRKDGKNQPLPAVLSGNISNRTHAVVYDLDLGKFHGLSIKRLP